MGIERLSKDQVSTMCRSLDAEVGELAARGLAGVEAPYLFLDATYVRCRRGGRVQSTAAATAIGVGSDGVRRILGIAAVDTETYAGWLGFLRSLRARALGRPPRRRRRPRWPRTRGLRVPAGRRLAARRRPPRARRLPPAALQAP